MRPRRSTALDVRPVQQECPGKSRAWHSKFANDPHPAHHRHPDCYKCGADMGCVRCSGPTYELLCTNGMHWGHPDAQKEHGDLYQGENRKDAAAFLRTILQKLPVVPEVVGFIETDVDKL